jgi:hypothetical protein
VNIKYKSLDSLRCLVDTMPTQRLPLATATSKIRCQEDNSDGPDYDDLPLAGLAARRTNKNTDLPSKIDSASSSNIDSSSKAHAPAQNIISNSPRDLRRFTVIPKLPVELRLKIWKHACYHGRNVSLWSVPLEGSIAIAGEEVVVKPFKWMSHHRIPAILHACSEARVVGLQHYTLTFDSRVEKQETEAIGGVKLTPTTPPRIYVNFAVDIICPFHLEGGKADEIYKDLATKPVKIIALSYNNIKWLLGGMLSHPTLEEAWLYHFEYPGDFECDPDQPFKIRILAMKMAEADKDFLIGKYSCTVKFKIMELDWL